MRNPFAPPPVHRDMKTLQAEGCRSRVDVGEAINQAALAGAAVTLATIVGRPLPPGTAPGHLALHRPGFMSICIPLWRHPGCGWFVDHGHLVNALALITDERCRVITATITGRES